MTVERLTQPEFHYASLSTGISVKTDVWRPSINSVGGGNKIAVFLHPWSWLGGRKEDPVLARLIQPFIYQGYHVLRYNSRGVGGSTGWASFTGFSEGEDLKALVQWAMNLISDVHSVIILGYSHGSLIASLHPVIPSVRTSHILLSYPLGPRGWLTLFKSSTYDIALKNLIRHPDSNVLIIVGDNDEFTSHSVYVTWKSGLKEKNLMFEVVENGSHFWHDESGKRLVELIVSGPQMPLPDERPRQSVANLIGRFETQTKRVSQISTGSPSRSSSVVSHITGDSTKEEFKERREWPPKPVVELEKPPLVLPSRQIPPALITQSSSAGSDLSSNNKWKKEASGTTTEEAEIPLTAKTLNASLRQNQGEPDSFLENWRKEISSQVNMEPEATPTAPEAPHSSQPTPIPGATQKLALPTTSRTTNVTKTTKTIATPSSKAPASTVSKPPVKTTSRTSTSKAPITPATPKPLKPQHTGQSVASTASRKPAPKAPTTPLKAPLRPDAAGSKTPTSAVRPKTPSSGLFAPTAASLARSRSAAPPVPQIASPPKKLVSSTSMDRLSKPTAASKAKTAATPAAMPSVRPTATGPRASAVKPKVPATPDKTVKKREPISSKGTSKPKAATGAVVAALVAGVGAATTLLAEDEGKTSDKGEEPEYSSVNGAEAKSDSSPNDEHVGGETQIDAEASTSSASVLGEVHSERGVPNEEHIETEDKQSVGSGNIELSPGSHSPVIEVSGEVVSDAGEPAEPQAERKDDLADIVNLLESVSITKDGEEAVDIPEEIQEIPEENDK